MPVERLLPAEPFGVPRHGPSGVVDGHPVQRLGSRAPSASGAGTTNPSRPAEMTSPAPLQAVVMTGRPQARASKTTSEHGIEIRWQDEEVAGEEAGPDLGLEPQQVDRPIQAEIPHDRPERTGVAPAAG